MYRTVKTPFRANRNVIQQLFQIRHQCGDIWNDCVELARYYYRLGDSWITKSQLQAELKGKYPLHSQTVQSVCHKFLQARDGVKEARKANKEIRYPYKRKFVFNPKWVDKAFSLEGNVLKLSLGNWNGKRQAPLVLKLAQVPVGEVKEVELVFDRTLQLCLSYDDGCEAPPSTGTHTTAIDVGEIHTISAVSTNEQAIIITGRQMRSIHRLRNKKLRELQKLMSKCQKGSRQWKKYNRAKRYVLSKSESQLRDVLHKTTKTFVDWCVSQEVKHVVIGDVEGVQRNTSKRSKNRKRKMHRNTNQKLSNWSFGRLYSYLSYKLDAKGISIAKEDESFTTQTCPVCGKRNKCRGRTYRCCCGYSQHRDVHGAANFLSKHLRGRFQEMNIDKIMYLRPA
ncbi:RNA-guided endonuclease InsQ/TnpB family protein [Bacillus luti]